MVSVVVVVSEDGVALLPVGLLMVACRERGEDLMKCTFVLCMQRISTSLERAKVQLVYQCFETKDGAKFFTRGKVAKKLIGEPLTA